MIRSSNAREWITGSMFSGNDGAIGQTFAPCSTRRRDYGSLSQAGRGFIRTFPFRLRIILFSEGKLPDCLQGCWKRILTIGFASRCSIPKPARLIFPIAWHWFYSKRSDSRDSPMDSKAPTGLHTPRGAKLFGIVALPWFALQNFLNPESGCIT